LDLLEPVIEQSRLIKKHGLPATWLLQYDALINDNFTSVLKRLDGRQEIGIWLEMVQPLVERAGLPWRGRPGYAWDWHADISFPIGYTPSEREKLTDIFMADFKEIFGYYPRSVGSWIIDAHLLSYLFDRYGITAACNCRDQWGTDGYTLWGGYFSQAYYPSRMNSLMPAQHTEAQIDVPVFRMLGSDPIYQYDAKIEENGQNVFTLEPVYSVSGASSEWVSWFFETILDGPSLTFGYTHVGQENSFGWPAMSEGLTYQVELVAQLAAAGRLQVKTLAETGEIFRSRYRLTPASAVTALSDWQGQRRKSVWYCSRYYRANFFWENKRFRIRDIHLFDENYRERYLESTCTTPGCTYDTLPVMEGFLWSNDRYDAGIRLVEVLSGGQCREIQGLDIDVKDGTGELSISWNCERGIKANMTCSPERLRFLLDPADTAWGLHISWDGSKEIAITEIEKHCLSCRHNGYAYEVLCPRGRIVKDSDSSILIVPDVNEIILCFSTRGSLLEADLYTLAQYKECRERG
jgi:hypothetical protein